MMWAPAPARLPIHRATLGKIKSPFWASGPSLGFTQGDGQDHGVQTVLQGDPEATKLKRPPLPLKPDSIDLRQCFMTRALL